MEQTEAKKPKKKLNSRWRKGAVRYSNERMVDDARWVRRGKFHRLESDSIGEIAFCERRYEGIGWRKGARITKH